MGKNSPNAKAAGLSPEAELTRQMLVHLMMKRDIGTLDAKEMDRLFMLAQAAALKILSIK